MNVILSSTLPHSAIKTLSIKRSLTILFVAVSLIATGCATTVKPNRATANTTYLCGAGVNEELKAAIFADIRSRHHSGTIGVDASRNTAGAIFYWLAEKDRYPAYVKFLDCVDKNFDRVSKSIKRHPVYSRKRPVPSNNPFIVLYNQFISSGYGGKGDYVDNHLRGMMKLYQDNNLSRWLFN